LAGVRAGKTVKLGEFEFVKGKFFYEGNDKTHEEYLAIYLERNFYAFPAGSAALKEANERYAREQESGIAEEPSAATDDEDEDEPNPTVKEAIDSLNHENDEHWTETGLPKLEAVGDLAGEKVTRQQAETAAPNYNRAAAKAAANI
jgi:hypothetical protein